MAKAERHMAICRGEKNQCVCLSKPRKTKALLLCCVKVQTPCPVHSTNRTKESRNAEARSTNDEMRRSLSLLQRLMNILCALLKKKSEPKQTIDNLLLENESFTTDPKELNQHILKENNDQCYFAEDDLDVAAQSMFSCNRRRPRKQAAKRVSEQILANYANYDENREMITFDQA